MHKQDQLIINATHNATLKHDRLPGVDALARTVAVGLTRRRLLTRAIGIGVTVMGLGALPGVRLFAPLPVAAGDSTLGGSCNSCESSCACESCNPHCFSPNGQWYVSSGAACCNYCYSRTRVKVCNDGSASSTCLSC